MRVSKMVLCLLMEVSRPGQGTQLANAATTRMILTTNITLRIRRLVVVDVIAIIMMIATNRLTSPQ